MKQIIFILSLAIIAVSCKKTDDELKPTCLAIDITHTVDDKLLYFDSLFYQNKVGEHYSISKLYYYLSDIHFYNNNQLIFAIDTILYVDANKKNQLLIFNNIIPFSFDSIAYSIGVPQSKNTHGSLPPTFENVAMEWPETMGGGYHFLKLEGHWQDKTSLIGFTVHIGTNPFLVAGGIKSSAEIIANKENTIALKMNINKWFEGESNYSFQTDGSYTMGNSTLMKKITENGKHVFELTYSQQ